MPRRPPVKKVTKDIDDVEKPAADIKKMYEEEKERPVLLKHLKAQQKGNVGPTQDIREYILRLSLFPNIFNHQ
jgi:hypothetical protein